MNKEVKSYIIEELTSWRETWDFDNEETENAHTEINKLIKKIKCNKIEKEDYENILFHIWQIAQGKEE